MCGGRGQVKAGDVCREIVRCIAENENIVKVFHNRIYDERVLKNEGTRVLGVGHDTMLMHYCLDPRRPHGLKPLAAEIGEDISDEGEVKNWIKAARRVARLVVKRDGYFILDDEVCINAEEITFRHVPWPIMYKYALRDAKRTMMLFHVYRGPIKKKPFLGLYRMELELSTHVAVIETTGMCWDFDMSKRLLKMIARDAIRFRNKAFKIAKKKFNLLSAKDLKQILFNELGLTVMHYTDKGNPSLAKDHLVEYDHPIATQVLRYRMATKMDKYIHNFIRAAHYSGGSWIIRPTILQHGTLTGRWSIINPPLQTTPAMDTGRRSHYIVDIRKCFIPRRGYIFYLQDYSQIEIKIFVHFSGEPEMRAIIDRGGDVHSEMGVLLTGVQEDDPEFSHVRKMIKMVNFGLIFGATYKKMHEITHEPLEKIRRFVDDYHNRFRGVHRFMDKIISQASRDGFVEAYGGRRIPVSRNKAYRAVNYLIQGTAAMVLKQGVIDISNYVQDYDGHVVLSMHDEIISEMPEEADHVKHIRACTTILQRWDKTFSVPLRIDNAVSATSWSDEIKIGGLAAKAIHRSVDKAVRLRRVRRKKPIRMRDLRIIR